MIHISLCSSLPTILARRGLYTCVALLTFASTGTTVRTEATSEVELEEWQGPAFWNVVLATSCSGQ